MVVKKYLCAAPRPESWEEKAEAFLKSLGGDKVKCKNVARQTLSMLKERHKHEKKRTGPGRKSNAEHAIAFYEYLAGDKGIGDEDNTADNDMESTDDDENSTSDQSSSIDTQEFLDQHDDACDVCNLGGELICCATCSLVFHEECLRPVMKSIPSDWICPYCITQGVNNFKRHSKTWKSAASGIRQMERLKKELESAPQEKKEDGDAKGDETKEEKEQTRKEESGVDNASESKKEEVDKNDEKPSAKEKEKGEPKDEDDQQRTSVDDAKKGDTSAASSVSGGSAAPDGKLNLALYKIADSYSNSTENLLVHGRRQRKQPTLYQPQLCADSRWKSDERLPETDGKDDDDTTSNGSDIESDSGKEDEENSATRHRNPRRVLKKKRTRVSKDKIEDSVVISVGEDAKKRDQMDSPFCNFCHDDASILICVFCGCRKCYGKHDKSSLLLCDNCDDEYHIKCLGLTTVPSAKKWFCPACTTKKAGPKLLSTRRSSSAKALAIDTEAGNESDSSPGKKTRSSSTPSSKQTYAEVLDKRTRSRPSKLRIEKETITTPSSQRKGVRTPKGVTASDEGTEQRKRGRPSKSTTNSPATTPSTGKKRGRPPKNVTTTPTSPSPTARKRGRPPKASPDNVTISSKTESASKKKVAKPTTPSSASSKSNNSEVTAKPQEPIKVSRVSGRMVKRASFHDEVDEGEQHLRSSKSPSSGDSQSAGHTSKAASSKSQDSQVRKTPEKSEPVRKKQKQDEKVVLLTTKDTPSETKSAKSQTKTSTTVDAKDEEMVDPPPIAPVRMKPVLQPPAPPIAPVRMKPVLQPPAPIARPPVPVPEAPSSIVKSESNTEDSKKVIVTTEQKPQEKPATNGIQDNPTTQTATKPEVSKKADLPPPASVPPKANKPPAMVAPKVVAPKTTTPRASPTLIPDGSGSGSTTGSSIYTSFSSTPLLDPVALEAAVKALPEPKVKPEKTGVTKIPRRKPGARECMQISRRFGVNIIPEKYMLTLLDYCHRGKVEHLIKMRERLDCHSRFLEFQLAGLEARIKEVGESKVVVPPMPIHKRDPSSRNRSGGTSGSVSPVPPLSNKKAATSGIATKAAVTAQQVAGKKQTPAPQALGATKTKPEITMNKPPTKPANPSKPIATSSSTIGTKTAAAAKPTLPPAVQLPNKTKT